MSYQSSPGFNSFGIGLKPTPMVKRLLIANVVVFAIQTVLPTSVMYDWFAFQRNGSSSGHGGRSPTCSSTAV